MERRLSRLHAQTLRRAADHRPVSRNVTGTAATMARRSSAGHGLRIIIAALALMRGTLEGRIKMQQHQRANKLVVRGIFRSTFAAARAVSARQVLAQAWLTKPASIVVSLPQFTRQPGCSIFIDNRGEAGGTIGASFSERCMKALRNEH